MSLTSVSSKSKTTYQSLHAARGIAAILVLLYHSEMIFSLQKYWAVKSHLFYFGANGVDFFFVLSGIVILLAHSEDLGRRKALLQYVWKRFRRIYPIYWVILAAMLVVYFSIPSFGIGYEKQPSVILDSLLLMPLTQVVTVLPIAWTLFHEVMFYFVFGILILSKRLGLIIFSLWMCWSVYSLIRPSSNPVLANFSSPLHLLFGLGLAVLVIMTRTSLPGTLLTASGTLGYFLCCVFEDFTHSSAMAMHLLTGTCSAIAMMGLMSLEKRGRLHISPILLLLGDASYSLYLVHYMILSLAAKVLFPLSIHQHLPTLVAFALAVGTAVGGGLAVHFCLEVPLLNYLPKRIK